MRIWISGKKIVCFLCFASLLFYAGSLSSAEKQPRIKFKQESWDFGKVKQGQALTYEFVFQNVGDEVLTIQKVTTSCGCTAALISEKKIAPGKEGKIGVTFNTQGYGGRVEETITVESDDPAQPQKQLMVRADIEVPPQPKIDLDRYSIDLGLVLEGEEIQAKVNIINRGELELKVECSHRNAFFSSAGKAIAFPLKIASGKDAEVEIKLVPQQKRGLLREYVLINSNDPLRSTLSLYLSGYIVSREQLKALFAKYKNILD